MTIKVNNWSLKGASHETEMGRIKYQKKFLEKLETINRYVEAKL